MATVSVGSDQTMLFFDPEVQFQALLSGEGVIPVPWELQTDALRMSALL